MKYVRLLQKQPVWQTIMHLFRSQKVATGMPIPEKVSLQYGSVLAGYRQTYQIVDKIGSGGFASVYKVVSQQKTYALKIIKLREIQVEERIEIQRRFEREYEAGQIHSPFIVSSVDQGKVRGNPFYVMEFCGGGSLREVIEEGKILGIDRIHQITLGILQGLHDLHSAGIIHKDLKPENILFTKDQTPKLTDFGISGFINHRMTVASWRGHAKTVFGTAFYAPPEQLDERVAFKSMGPTNDIFSFGVLLYEMISGGFLPVGPKEVFLEHIEKYYEKIGQQQIIPLRAIKKNIPEKWDYIIAKCLRADPATRFQSATEILSVLGKPVVRDQHRAMAGKGHWVLKVMNGEEVGKIYDLTRMQKEKGKRALTLGWYDLNHLCLNDIEIKESYKSYISQRHATLEYIADEKQPWIIKDGQWYAKNGAPDWHLSTNGVLVNSLQAGKNGHFIFPNDIITIGDTTLKVEVV